MKDKWDSRIKIGNPINNIGANCKPDQISPIKHKTLIICRYFFHFSGFLANQITNGKFNGNNIKEAGFQAITSWLVAVPKKKMNQASTPTTENKVRSAAYGNMPL